jgi:inorganic pyrophosphatase
LELTVTAYADRYSLVNQIVKLQIDRPLGSRHPKAGFIFPVNYGFVPGVQAPDGDCLDAYLLGVFEPVDSYTGRCIAVVHRSDDDDDKLVVVPDGREYSDEQIEALTEFLERFFSSSVMRNALIDDGSQDDGVR